MESFFYTISNLKSVKSFFVPKRLYFDGQGHSKRQEKKKEEENREDDKVCSHHQDKLCLRFTAACFHLEGVWLSNVSILARFCDFLKLGARQMLGSVFQIRIQSVVAWCINDLQKRSDIEGLERLVFRDGS